MLKKKLSGAPTCSTEQAVSLDQIQLEQDNGDLDKFLNS